MVLKLDLRPLNEDPRPIDLKLKCHLHGTILEGNSIGLNQKNGAQRKARGFENQDVT